MVEIKETPDVRASTPALDTMGREEVLRGLELITQGRLYDLGLELGEHIPQGAPGAFVPFSMSWRTTPEECARNGHAHQFAAETVIGALHVGTHIDGLAHIASKGRVFGGHAVADVRTDRGFRVHGMEKVRPIVTRGIVLDIAGNHEVDALPDGYEVTIQDIREALSRSSIELRAGDVVCVRTGKVREYYTDAEAYQRAQPGVGPAAAIWLYERGMAVLGTDTTGTEPLPFPDENHTTHKAMLVDRGVHLIENLFLDEVASDGAGVGLFVCLPLRITGATGSWVRPVLIV